MDRQVNLRTQKRKANDWAHYTVGFPDDIIYGIASHGGTKNIRIVCSSIKEEKDAQLMSASPQLLDACKKALKHIPKNKNTIDVIQEIEEAIQKATEN